MLLLFALLVGTASAYTLTCHCRQSSTCPTNGFCANGCAEGWHGPGCQVGNLALGKAAQQSTTLYGGAYSASRAVDGILQSGNDSDHCAHTDLLYPALASNSSAWWDVTLDVTRYFFITNITIVNRQSENSNRLSNFVILYSNETTGNPDPSNSTWYEYAKENGTFNNNRTYSSNSTVVAKRVAVYLTGVPGINNHVILTLCEVLIYGYEYYNCPGNFTGPGCLLRTCDHCASNHAQCTREFDSCLYDVCPEQSLLPPDCWITATNPSTLNVSWKPACNSVLFSFAVPDTQANIAASSLQLHVTSSADHKLLDNATLSLQATNSTSYTVGSAAANTSYTLFFKLEYCNNSDGSCFLSKESQVHVRTGMRKYNFSHNTSCVFVMVTPMSQECETLDAIQITCESQAFGVATRVSSSNSPVCGLRRGQAYNCSVAAIVNATTIESQSEYIVMELLPTSTVPTDISALAGSIGGSIIVIFAIVAIIVVVYCRQQKNARSHAPTVKLVAKENDREPAGNPDVNVLPSSFSTGPLIDDEEQAYSNLCGMTLLQFQLYVQDEALIARRFTELQANEARPCIRGKNPENKGKNRFQNILPYDLNRVRLDCASSDYINASYINGCSKTKEYIAAQGPSLKTMDDFWHMLWQEKCSVIIMLTDYVEHAKKKCEKYFPVSEQQGINFEVTVRSQTVCDTHTVTVLNVRHGPEGRLLHHFHFLAWPDQSVPSHNAEMLLFYSRIGLHLKRHPSKGPVVVHCSAGVGRTGAYIAFDYLQQSYQSEGTVDVDGTVIKLRDQRMFMVQTKEQYLFLHLAVLYGLKTARYIYDTALLPSLARVGSSPSSGVSSDMAKEWQELQTVVPKFHEQSFAAAVLPENKHKNRRSDILALELKRPILFRHDGGDQLYINAVYCNGCYSNRAFIATQVPLRQTVADFWLMVYDCQPSCIILLHDLPTSDGGSEDCARYWPDPGHSITVGGLEVKCSVIAKDESAMNVRMPGFDISLSPVSRSMADSQMVATNLFTTSLWDITSSAELPARPNDFVLVANALRTYFAGAPQQPIIVQCRDGVTQSGLFLSVVNALHRLIETDQVSVFHTVDLLRASRPEFVTSEAQYHFIYQVLETYRSTTNVYANTESALVA